jgi:hypothetical protein
VQQFGVGDTLVQALGQTVVAVSDGASVARDAVYPLSSVRRLRTTKCEILGGISLPRLCQWERISRGGAAIMQRKGSNVSENHTGAQARLDR